MTDLIVEHGEGWRVDEGAAETAAYLRDCIGQIAVAMRAVADCEDAVIITGAARDVVATLDEGPGCMIRRAVAITLAQGHSYATTAYRLEPLLAILARTVDDDFAARVRKAHEDRSTLRPEGPARVLIVCVGGVRSIVVTAVETFDVTAPGGIS